MFLIYALDSLFFCENAIIVTFEIFVNSARIDLSKYHLGGYIFTQPRSYVCPSNTTTNNLLFQVSVFNRNEFY